MKLFLLVLFVGLIGIQFYRPVKNLSAESPSPHDLVEMYSPPVEVKDLLARACYDCHSNHTRYPWYAEIQPVGWWLADHVEEAKSHLNFSKFGSYTRKRQIHKLEEMIGELEEGEMPLTSYKLIHADARLTGEQINALINWADDMIAHIEAH